jgi:hypothetical protein
LENAGQDAATSSFYHPKDAKEHPINRKREKGFSLSAEEEATITATLGAELKRGRAITLSFARDMVKNLAHVRLSRQTMRRLLIRHGFRQIRRAGFAMWINDEPVEVEGLWNELFDEKGARLLTTEKERALLQEFENATSQGEPVTRTQVKAAMKKVLGISVSANAATKLLRRNGWRQIQKNRRAFWVAGNPPNLAELWDRLDTRTANAICSREEENALMCEFQRRLATGENINSKEVVATIYQQTGRTISVATAISLLHRHGWQKIGGSSNTRWVKKVG